MYKICIFGGTTEGRKLTEFLAGKPVSVTVCVATEYGEELLEAAENIRVSSGRLPKAEIEKLFFREGFDLVVDATHPYAEHITQTVSEVCREMNIEHIRLLRDGGEVPENAVLAADTEAAVSFLNSTAGTVLLTTGSKELPKYAALRDFSNRVYARVLPLEESLTQCREAGLKPSHIIAMQGPFSEEMNLALMNAVGAKYLVTKDGGSAGGFAEKIAAAKKAGAVAVIVGRPKQSEGLSLNAVMDSISKRLGLPEKQTVTVVGIGPGSAGALTVEGSRAIECADCVIGAGRMIEAVACSGQASFAAIDPNAIASYIAEHPECSRVAVVMSGDTGFFSGTKKLLPLLSEYSVTVLPGISSLSYLCARLGCGYEDVFRVSLHGREHNIVGDVLHHRRVFALVGGQDGVSSLCRRLTESGLGAVTVSVGERLSYPDEKLSVGKAYELCGRSFDPLSAVLIENDRPDYIVTGGLPDEAFLRNAAESPVVPMTKSEVRAVCLSKLQLTENALCWDIGAGTGSVSVEMARLATKGFVYAVEQKENAIPLLNENRERFFAENITVIHGSAPVCCAELPAPTRVFIGGSSGNMRGILDAVLSKNPHARIVATAVTLESISELTECMKKHAFDVQEVVAVNVSRSRSLGQYHLMTAQNPVTIFTMQNTGGDA